MQEFFILVRSITYAQKTACVLKSNNICCKIVRRPRGITVSGCGYAVWIGSGDLSRACNALQGAGLPSFRIFGTPDGRAYMEIYCGV